MSSISVRKELFINGRWVQPALRGLLRVVNPATERELAEVGFATQADVDKAVRAASASFPAWSATPAFQRAEFLRKIARLVRERSDDLSRHVRQALPAAAGGWPGSNPSRPPPAGRRR